MIKNLNDYSKILDQRKKIEKRIFELEKRLNAKKQYGLLKSPKIQKSKSSLSKQKYNLTILPSKSQQDLINLKSLNQNQIICELKENIESQNSLTEQLKSFKNQHAHNFIHTIQNTNSILQDQNQNERNILVDKNYRQQCITKAKISPKNILHAKISNINGQLTQRRDVGNNQDSKQISLHSITQIEYNNNLDQQISSRGEYFLNIYEKQADTNQSQSSKYSPRLSYNKLIKTKKNKHQNNLRTEYQNSQRSSSKMDNILLSRLNSLDKQKVLYSELFFEISQRLSPGNISIYKSVKQNQQSKIVITEQIRLKMAQKIANRILISQKHNIVQNNKNEKYINNNGLNMYDLQKKLRNGMLEKINLMRNTNKD